MLIYCFCKQNCFYPMCWMLEVNIQTEVKINYSGIIMQQRHLDRQIYFNELANTSREFYIDYLKHFCNIDEKSKILEIGCGEGGNLLPFAEIGCEVTGIDLSSDRISQAKEFFSKAGHEGNFIANNFLETTPKDEDKYDIILIHDVIEHIEDKMEFMKHAKEFLKKDGVIFWGFPAWQMPFGGHQQICKNKMCSLLPFIHLLPKPIYRSLLKAFGESQSCINELMSIKSCKMTIEAFERISKKNNYVIIDRFLWFINPHYKQKFHLKPRKLYNFLSRIKYVRNFFSTSCFYMTKYNQ